MVLSIAAILASVASTAYGIWKNEQSRKKMAQSEKERMALEDEYQDENALEAYQRQKQFQDDYLTPEAQIKSTLAGYTAAGINKMALAGVSPGASASSVPESAGPSGTSPVPQDTGALGGLMDVLNLKLKDKQIEKQYEVDKINADANKLNAEAAAAYARSRTAGQDITNSWLNRIYGADVANKEQQTENLRAVFQSEQLKQDLTMRHIQIADQDLAIKEYQAAQQKAISDNADEYYAAVAKLSTANALLASGQASIFSTTWKKQVAAAKAQLNNIIIEAGMNGKIFTGQAFTKQTEGKMTDAEKTQMWVDVGKGILNVAVGAGLGYMVGGRSAMPTMPYLSFPQNGYFNPADVYKLTGGMPLR